MRIIKTTKYIEKYAEMAERAVGEGVQTTDATILRQSIIAESDAVNLYEQFARSTSNEKLKKVLLSVAREEKVHSAEFEKLLSEIDNDFDDTIEEGSKEVDDQ
jgi:rubrerythrin